MSYKKMLLVEPDSWNSLRQYQMTSQQGRPANDISVSQMNDSILQRKTLEKNVNKSKWDDFGKNLTPIITNSLTTASNQLVSPPNTTNLVSTPVASSSSSPQSAQKADPMIALIADSTTSNYYTKALRLYMLLKDVPGIRITPSSIIVDGKELFGLSTTNIGQLVKPNKYLSFQLGDLLAKIYDRPDITELIANQQAKAALNAFERVQSNESLRAENVFETSTPKSAYRKNKRKPNETGSDTASGLFLSGLEDTPTNLTVTKDKKGGGKKEKRKARRQGGKKEKKRGKKKFSWKTIF